MALLENLNRVRSKRPESVPFSQRLDFLMAVCKGLILTARIFIFHPNLFHLLGFYNETLPYLSFRSLDDGTSMLAFTKTRKR